MADEDIEKTKKMKKMKERLKGKRKREEVNNNLWKCDQCQFSSQHSGSLYTHVQSVHEKRVFTCDVCDKSFRQKISLIKHQEVHDDSKHECVQCGKEYNTTQKF